jgi:alkylhydroperoxidase/carboxymuconolactone decarboxylase family protein YurZ
MTDAADAYPQTRAHREAGDWNPLWEKFREFDPDFLEAYLAFRAVPQTKGPLERKHKELILIAVNAATTHLYGPGVRRHIRNALEAGATAEEILETIQLTSIIGIHACNLALPILEEELRSSPRGADGDPANPAAS